jgi:hypothetical protein
MVSKIASFALIASISMSLASNVSSTVPALFTTLVPRVVAVAAERPKDESDFGFSF